MRTATLRSTRRGNRWRTVLRQEAYLLAGRDGEKSGIMPSASVGCVIVMSRNTVYGIPAFMAS